MASSTRTSYFNLPFSGCTKRYCCSTGSAIWNSALRKEGLSRDSFINSSALEVQLCPDRFDSGRQLSRHTEERPLEAIHLNCHGCRARSEIFWLQKSICELLNSR